MGPDGLIHLLAPWTHRSSICLRPLESKGLLENSWIAFLSAYGLMEAAHELIHKHTLFQQNTQPSLIVCVTKGAGGGKRISHLMDLMDLISPIIRLTSRPRSKRSRLALASLLRVFVLRLSIRRGDTLFHLRTYMRANISVEVTLA